MGGSWSSFPLMNAQPPISRRRVDVKSEAKSSWVEGVMGVPS